MKALIICASIHHGPVVRATGERTRPRFIPGQLAAAAQAALRNGADLDLPEVKGKGLAATRVEELEMLLDLVRPSIFGAGPEKKADAGVEDGAAEPAGDDLQAPQTEPLAAA